MLLDDEKKTVPDAAPERKASSGNPRKGLLVLLVLLGLGVGAWYAFQHAGLGGDMGGIRGGSAPPPSIFKVKPGAPVPPADKDWAVCANPAYEYWFRYPTKWTLSIPDEYDRGRSRMLTSPDQKVHMVVIPFGLYDQDKKSEMDKAQFTYLGDHTVKSDKVVKVNGREAFRRSYLCRVSTAAGFEETPAEGYLIEARPKGYLWFLWGQEDALESNLPTFEKVVASFHVEKLPLENAAGGAAPPTDAARPSSTSETAAPSPAAGSPAAGAPAPSPAAGSPAPQPASPAVASPAPK